MTKRETVLGIIYLVIHAVFFPLLFQIIGIFVPKIEDHSELLNLLMYFLGFLFCVIFLFKFLKQSFIGIFDLDFDFIKIPMQGVGTNYVLSIGVAIIIAVFALASGDLSEITNPNNEAVVSMITTSAMQVTSVLLAPILEECLFRGAIFGSIRKKNRFLAYLITVALFSFYHLWQYFVLAYDWHLWLTLLQYVPAGLILCKAYERSGNIWCSILAHATINFISVLLLNYVS